jgi:hypothetical protein
MKVSGLSAEIEFGYDDSFKNFAQKLIELAKQTGVSVKAKWPSFGGHKEITASPTSTLGDLED